MTKAMANASSQNASFASLDVTTVQPSGDGVFGAGDGGAFADDAVLLMPYASPRYGASFRMRVYGWQRVLGSPAVIKAAPAWIPLLLATLTCKTGRRNGLSAPYAGETGNPNDSDFFCNEIALDRPILGNEAIWSNQDCLDTIGAVRIDLCGCRLFQIDFEQIDQVAMNCFLAKQ